MNSQTDDFNRRANEYLGGHARNVVNSLAGRPLEKVRPWFGEGGLRTDTSGLPASSPAPATKPAAALVTAPPQQAPVGVVASGQELENPAISPLARNRTQPTVAPPNTKTGEPIPNTGITRTLSSGMRQTDSGIGSVFEMGTPGQDGYGRMVVHPRAGGGQAAGNQAINRLAGGTTSAKTPSGIEITGPADAVERLSRPVAPPAQQHLTGRMIQPRTADYSFLDGPKDDGKPKYLGKESGLGWKTRLGLYKEQMDTYNRERGLSAGMDLEAMREAGAGQRALLQAKGVNDANEIAMRRLTGELGLNEARIASEGLGQQQAQMELDRAKQERDLSARYLAESDPAKQKALGKQILMLQGKFAENKPVFQRIQEDDGMGGQRERLFQVNGNGTMTEVLPTITQADVARQRILMQDMKESERKWHMQKLARQNPALFDYMTAPPPQASGLGGGGGDQRAMLIIRGNPAYQKAYDAATPENRLAMIAKVNERLRQTPAQ